MAFSLHNHCPCRVLCRVHTRLTTAPPVRIDASCTSTATCKSLCAWKFLSCLTLCWSASSFDKQVDSVKEHLTRTQTDSLFVCGLVTSKMLLWFGLYKSCHRHAVGQNAAPHCRIPGKGSEFFFLWISHCQLCELLETWWQHSAMSAGAGWSALEPRGSFSILQSWHGRCPRPARSSNSACWTRSPEKKE